MTEEFKLLAQLPFADPEAEAVNRIAVALEQPVSLGPEGAPEINTPAFLVYGFRPDDVDRQAVAQLFGVDINLTLVITDPEAAKQTVSPVAQSMARIALLLAAVPGAEGVIVTDYVESSIILRFKDGQVTLNQDWTGWQSQPDVLAAVPEPRTMRSLQGRN